MKVKKIENIVFFIGAGAALFSLLCTLFAPLFVEGSLRYNGFEVFGKGFVTLFSFNFSNPVVLLLFFLFLISLVCLGLWAWQIVKTHDEEDDNLETWIKFGAVALSIIVIFALTAGTFVPTITLGETEKVLFDTLKFAKDSGFGKFLVVLSLASSYASLAACTLYAFINFGMLNLLGPDYRDMDLPVGGKK